MESKLFGIGSESYVVGSHEFYLGYAMSRRKVLCLDTGHLMIGGTDPAAFARAHGDRVTHVHLKDVDAAIAAALTAGRMSLVEATRAGLFVPLGHGAAPVAQTLQALNEHRYDGWLVLEQDTAITADEPAVTSAPMLAVRQSIAFLNSAHTTEEIIR